MRLVLEITPFFTTIVIEILSVGVNLKFEDQLEKLDIDKVLDQTELDDTKDAATHSFHFEQCMLYYDFGMVAVVIVFLTKSLDPSSSVNPTVFAGVASFLVMLFARVLTQKYFENRDPNKYANIDRFGGELKGHSIYLYYKAIFVVIANFVPIFLLLFVA